MPAATAVMSSGDYTMDEGATSSAVLAALIHQAMLYERITIDFGSTHDGRGLRSCLCGILHFQASMN